MRKLLKLTNDYVFKRIFGKVGNEDITRSFIKAATGIEFKNINLEDSPILEIELIESKIGILDVKVIAELVEIEDDKMNYNDLKDKFLEKENEIYHIVKAMLKENLDINLISRVTGLTDEEIKAIK